jgi:subtilisin family serine protease
VQPALRFLLLAVALTAATLGAFSTAEARNRKYVVVYDKEQTRAAVRATIAAAGGRVVRDNRVLGVAVARSSAARFAVRARRAKVVTGVVANRRIGRIPRQGRSAAFREFAPQPGLAGTPSIVADRAVGDDPLTGRQWDMAMIGATSTGSYAHQQGSSAVRVGILDSGVDASHPDIAANFDRRLSRNFAPDIPAIDGPCEEEPDQSCDDPPDVDDAGHGTHVAGTVAAPLNGVGMAGVAPKVSLVSIRVGQDSGYVFLLPVLRGLVHAATHGVDVVNMSFFIDPWLYNCSSNPADSPAAQLEQRTIVAAMQRAVDYARSRNVTVVASLGNNATDLGRPTSDTISPTYPAGSGYPRDIDNTCKVVPAELSGVIAVSSLGPSKRKSYFSNYGLEQTDVSAPGGDGRDAALPAPTNRILGPYPAALGRIAEQDPAQAAMLVKDGQGNYWRYAQGTSMSAPHAVGVAALAVAETGKPDPVHGGLTQRPGTVESMLRLTAVDTACPSPPLFDYPEPETGPAFNALCEGSPQRNGFYGDGIVSASGIVGG